ncbi:site-specific integrase [Flavobacteriales bacterium]|nr:site-specific integrase [Flavobacteriales bacterium]
MTTSFFIRPTKTLAGKIYVLISEGRGHQFRFSTGHEVKHVSHWNDKTQLVRTVAAESHDIINHQLKRLKAHIETEFYQAKSEGRRRNKAFYEAVMSSFSVMEGDAPKAAEKTLEMAFERLIDLARSNDPRVPLAPKTITTYVTTLNHLRFLGMADVALSDLDMDWYYDFISRSEDGGRQTTTLAKNYIAKMVKKVKRVLRFAEDSGEKVHPAYKSTSFKAQEETADNIYLDRRELEAIAAVDILPQNTSMRRSRDLFLIGCYTGLRVSDYTRLSREHIVNVDGVEFFEIASQKTGQLVTIPIHPVVREIIKSNDGMLPERQPEQVINQNIKTIGAMAGINEKVTIEKTTGGRKVRRKYRKFQLIKTHTARRSFCTNAYLEGLDCLDIMAVSGHTSEANFLKYIKVTRRETAKRLAEHPFFQRLP